MIYQTVTFFKQIIIAISHIAVVVYQIGVYVNQTAVVKYRSVTVVNQTVAIDYQLLVYQNVQDHVLLDPIFLCQLVISKYQSGVVTEGILMTR